MSSMMTLTRVQLYAGKFEISRFSGVGDRVYHQVYFQPFVRKSEHFPDEQAPRAYVRKSDYPDHFAKIAGGTAKQCNQPRKERVFRFPYIGLF